MIGFKEYVIKRGDKFERKFLNSVVIVLKKSMIEIFLWKEQKILLWREKEK